MPKPTKIFIALVVVLLIIGGGYVVLSRKFIKLGTLSGKIGVYEGNCMPSPGRPGCIPGDIQARVYITSPLEKYEKSQVVKTLKTDEQGYFQIDLPIGDYSLFMYDDSEQALNACKYETLFTCDSKGAYICGGWTGICANENCDSYSTVPCTPFTIKEKQVTNISSNINHAAW